MAIGGVRTYSWLEPLPELSPFQFLHSYVARQADEGAAHVGKLILHNS